MELSTIDQAAFIYYHFLAIFGFPANFLTIVLLSRGGCGLSKGITLYLSRSGKNIDFYIWRCEAKTNTLSEFRGGLKK
ncbi:uncharacterized protein LOC119970411 isoform X2 [Scyliorhinus canicula]|uniref:uncharacterized protein LOC119970411 isoform X2 n=1 Tax=Scyliorhinus canicula TaxID=7830 RepID=UPI0018F4E4F2|nr:uncharacterized protein LOC119970411 isoform X2 [Scyliorhinus canicula]